MWWFIIAAAVGYIVLSDSGSGDSGPIGMPGPLLPGQDRPTY
jgi:hypothetical protein